MTRRITFLLPADENGCWIWPYAIALDGYGKWKTIGAHRWVYTQLVGAIPQGLELDHLCRVRACVNPSHLEPVTRQENIRRWVASITHCKSGHEFNDENTYRSKDGRRRCCRVCNRAAAKRYAARRAGRVDAA